MSVYVYAAGPLSECICACAYLVFYGNFGSKKRDRIWDLLLCCAVLGWYELEVQARRTLCGEHKVSSSFLTLIAEDGAKIEEDVQINPAFN